MGLNRAQRAMVEKARTLGGGVQGVALSESACAYIVGTIVADLGLKEKFPEFPSELPAFFDRNPIGSLEVPNIPFMPLLERLIDLVPDADTYFASLAKLHKTRLKYERILKAQPIPTMEQVGPRALLEFGKLSPHNLTAYLFWRKWVFDIDNRAAQETGYLFEPIIASAIGGVPASARRSPIRRHKNSNKGRQVDCIKGDHAYEFKLRVTIAASGQGRWREELEFPRDCRGSGYIPVLVVLDPTPNPKLRELCRVFQSEKGKVYIGESAWNHLNEMAGPTMATFLDHYVHSPIRALLEETPDSLPTLTLRMCTQDMLVNIGDESFEIIREDCGDLEDEPVSLPDDIDEETPGP